MVGNEIDVVETNIFLVAFLAKRSLLASSQDHYSRSEARACSTAPSNDIHTCLGKEALVEIAAYSKVLKTGRDEYLWKHGIICATFLLHHKQEIASILCRVHRALMPINGARMVPGCGG